MLKTIQTILENPWFLRCFIGGMVTTGIMLFVVDMQCSILDYCQKKREEEE